ncbi:hypothetical protein CHLRE_10g464250v5 [Chlamydomonas reinhardtii]|uniref:Uncharacterized protein n=1 Tax=Chlamydomonas reinhardtii TaxID=3055 RepID=A8I1I2_CHLRE|nr:uncharacterized protein CHLRE_10g464250v5 [Chlamydomonas reinhardtii]PNW78100.1 hypothetical protein CHLRE_10g464250v5 [Chlamydomonas reinhardtii]|eukprot:XP_001698619.1 SOUL3-like protein [Chlamydomonas reinhardtii]
MLCHSKLQCQPGVGSNVTRRLAIVVPLAQRKQGALAATTKPAKSRQKDNPFTIGLVTVLTEALRVLGVGKERYVEVAAAPSRAAPVRRGDVAGLMRRLTADFKQAYFVTGVLDDSIYEPDCYFADPTVAFRGTDLWKRNLALLTPFLEAPNVQLYGMRQLGRDEDGAEVVRAEWRLTTILKLPWRPLIDLDGATEYTLNEESNRIVRHVEFWSISGTEAVLQMFRPSGTKAA